MNREEITEQIDAILYKAAGEPSDWKKCTGESVLTTDLGLSSADMLYVIVTAEEQFGIRFDLSEFSKCKTVGDIADLISKEKERLAQ